MAIMFVSVFTAHLSALIRGKTTFFQSYAVSLTDIFGFKHTPAHKRT